MLTFKLVILLVFSSKLVSSEKFRYSGLDSARLVTTTRDHQTDYFYTYNIGENLSIGCEHDEKRRITFKFHNSTSSPEKFTHIIEPRFEHQAASDLSSSYLLCYYLDEETGDINAIKLYLQARTLMFSGLDPARLRKSSGSDYIYSYIPGELLSIGCGTGRGEASTFQFCDSTTKECSYITPSNRKFERHAAPELNFSYLLCTVPGDHICVYLNNGEVPQNPPSVLSTPVAALQPNTHTGRTDHTSNSAITSAVSHLGQHHSSGADKICFTGFPRDLIITETHPAATDYVYKYQIDEELKVNCTANPEDGEIIFQFDRVDHPSPPVTMNSFVYTAISDISGSTVICKLQNNGITVYTKKVQLLLDTAGEHTPHAPAPLPVHTPRPTTPGTPATLPTTTMTTTASGGKVINNHPTTRHAATNRPSTYTTKRPTTKRPTTKRPTTKRPTTKRPTTKRPTTKRPTTKRTATPREPVTKKPKTTEAATRVTSTTMKPTVASNTANSKAFVKITGASLIVEAGRIPSRMKYSYKYKELGKLTLNCTVGGVIGDYEIILQNEGSVGARRQFHLLRNSSLVYSVSHTFTLTTESRSINCTAKDLKSNATRFTSTVALKYEPDSTTTTSAPSTPYGDTTKPKVTLPPEIPSGPEITQTSTDNLYKLVAIGVVALVTLCVVIVSLALVCRQKKPEPLASNYANLTNDGQHDYLTMPVPVPAPRKPLPTVEGTYSEPKDSNDMSEALYADPNVFRAVKSEETYAEPYNAKNELYTTPIPKAQRANMLKDDQNYGNVFGKDYVNSKPK